MGLIFGLAMVSIGIALMFFLGKWFSKLFLQTDLASPNILNDQMSKQEWAATIEKLGKTIEEVYTITRKYGEVLESSSSGFLMDENLLPYPKESIKWAIVFRAAWEQTLKDHWIGEPWAKISKATLASHRQVFKDLSLFVPTGEAAQTQNIFNLVMVGKK